MNQLMKNLERYEHLAPQGSEEWLEARRYRFGGSEVATILGENPYQTVYELVNMKRSKKPLRSVACVWGTLLEEFAVRIYEKKHNVEVFHFGSIPHSNLPLAYSPDGMCIINDQLVLLEFKCPITRKIKNCVPKHYLPQLHTGLDITKATYSIFIDNKFRKCSLETWDFTPTFRYKYHRDKFTGDKPLYVGMITFHTNEVKNMCIDFGKARYKEMSQLIDININCTKKTYLFTEEEFEHEHWHCRARLSCCDEL